MCTRAVSNVLVIPAAVLSVEVAHQEDVVHDYFINIFIEEFEESLIKLRQSLT